MNLGTQEYQKIIKYVVAIVTIISGILTVFQITLTPEQSGAIITLLGTLIAIWAKLSPASFKKIEEQLPELKQEQTTSAEVKTGN